MKFLLVVTLVAYTLAEAEPEADADPALLLAGSPLVYGAVGAVHHVPTVSVKTVAPAEVKTVVNPVTYTYGLGYPYGYHGLGYAGLGGYLGYPYLPVVAAPAAEEEPAVEAADRKKREAEAEADPEADPWLLYSGLHHYTTPYVYTAAPTVTVKAAEPVKTTLTYSTLGYPYTYGLGYGYHGLGYAGLGGYLGYPYLGLVPTVAAAAEEEPAVEAADRKRRDADADPAVIGAYSRILSAPTPIIHAPAVTYHAPYTYGLRYPYYIGK